MPFKAVWTQTTPGDPCTITIAPAADDFLLAFYVNDANTANDFAPPSGWTEACELQNNTDNQSFVVWYKKADGTETSVSFDANSGNAGIGAVVSLSGIDTTTPLDVTPVTFNNNTSATTSDISITPTTNGCDIVFIAGNDRTSSGNTSFTFSTESGTTGSWVTEADINSGFMNGGLGVASQTTAGAITARCTTDTAGGRSGILFALRPAAGTFDIEQEGFRFGIDDASESAHTWAQAQDTDDTVSVGTSRLIRAILNATGDPAAIPFALRYQKNGAGGYMPVPIGANTAPVLSYGADGAYAYSSNGGTTVAPAYPSGITTNSGLVLIIGQKPSSANGGTATTPSGWTLQGSLTGANDGNTGGYTTTLGADTGNCNIFVYTKDTVSGSESGTLSVTIGTNNVAWAMIIRIDASDRVGAWSWECGVGKDTSAGSVSIATGSMSIASGDFIVAGMVIPTDVTTPSQFSAQALSQSGTTFGTVTEIAEADSATGNDIGGFVVQAPVSSGSGSGAATLTATAGGTTTNVRGPGFVLRARVTSAVNEIYIAPSSNVASGGEATTARLTAPSGKSTSDFTTGRRWDDENGTDTIDIASGFYTELEWAVSTQSPAANGDYFDFRVYASTVSLTTYTLTPRLTLSSAAHNTTTTSINTAIQAPRSTSFSLALAIQQARTAAASINTAVAIHNTATASIQIALQQTKTATASLNTAIRQGRTASIVEDLAIQVARTSSHLIDLAINQNKTASASINTVIQRALNAVASIDTVIQQHLTVSTQISLMVQAVTSATFAIDLQVQVPSTLAIAIDIAILQAKTAVPQIDTAVQTGRTSSAILDTVIRTANNLNIAVNTGILTSHNTSTSVETVVQQARSATANLEAAIRATNSTTTSIEAAIRAAMAATVLLDTAVAQRNTSSITIDAAIQRALNALANVDTVIAISHTLSTQISLLVQAATNASFSINLQVQIPSSVSAALDLVILQSKTASIPIDVAIQLAKTAQANINTAVSQSRSALTSLDVPIKASYTLGTSISTAIQTSRTAQTSIDSAVALLRTASVSLNMQIQAGFTQSSLIDLAISQLNAAITSINTAVQIGRQAFTVLDLVVALHNQMIFDIDMLIQARRSVLASVSLYVDDGSSIVPSPERTFTAVTGNRTTTRDRQGRFVNATYGRTYIKPSR